MGQLVVHQIKGEASRLDKFLVVNIPKYSRSVWREMINNGSVQVNGRVVKPHLLVKEGDIITWSSLSRVCKTSGRPKTSSTVLPLKIIAVKPDYLVINKPAGLLTHDNFWPSRQPTVVGKLAKKYPEILSLGNNPARPGLVHRLDKDVSGLMVVPRTEPMFDSLKRQFKYHTVKKVYTGLVYGTLSRTSGVINFKLDRSTSGRKMAARPLNQVGKSALTEYEVIRQWTNYSLLQITIKTGRTHQIRAHLAAIGHPLVGDNWYGTNKTKIKNKELGINRVFLVATQLSFLDLAKVRQTFSLRLPRQMTSFFNTLK